MTVSLIVKCIWWRLGLGQPWLNQSSHQINHQADLPEPTNKHTQHGYMAIFLTGLRRKQMCCVNSVMMLPSPEISVDHRGAGADAVVTSQVIVSAQILDCQTYTPSPRTQPLNKRPTPRFTRPSKFTFFGLGISTHSLSVFQLLVSC